MSKLKRGFKTILGFASAFLLVSYSYVVFCSGSIDIKSIGLIVLSAIVTVQLITDIMRGKEL